MQTKITLVGAGSVVFAKKLITDLLQFPELRDCHIALMDIAPDRLKVAEVMTRKIIAKLGIPAVCSAHLDRAEAIKGAKYVICSIQVGGYKPGTLIDFEIPKKYGLKQTIADTLGIGGIFRTLRTAPALLGIAEDIDRVGAPGCLLLNYTNPMAMLCMAVERAVGIPMVGLCHSVQHTTEMLAGFAGLSYDDVTYKVAGINHMAFILDFKYRDRDAYPLLFKLLEDPDFTEEKVRMEMMRRTGYFVTESSEHQSEYVPHFIHHGDDIIRKFDIPIDEYLRRCEAVISTWERTEKTLLGEDGEFEIDPQSQEYGSYIIHSMETNTRRVVYGNVPNRNLITNLPDRCCVELPVLVDRNGLQPTHIGDLPPQLAAICRSNINVQELTVEAVLSGKREHIYHAAMNDPHTAATLTLDNIWALCDDLIDAHTKEGFLPEYEPTIATTGRSSQGFNDKAFLSIKPVEGQSHQYELIVRNESEKPFQADVTIELLENTQRLEDLPAIPVDVAANADASYAFSVSEKHQEIEYTLHPLSSNYDTVSQPFKRISNRIFETPVLETKPIALKNGADIELEGFGENIATGKMALYDRKLYLSLEVNDTDVRTNPYRPWETSCIDVRVSKIGLGSNASNIWILPNEGKSPVIGRMKLETKEHSFQTKIEKGGYTLNGHFDLNAFNIDPDEESFLFDFRVTVGALGTAHGHSTGDWAGGTVKSGEGRASALIKPVKTQ